MDKNFALMSMIVAGALTLAFGFTGFLIAAIGTLCLWGYSIQRGLLFIRSFVFLETLEMGKSVAEANYAARCIRKDTPALAEIAYMAQTRILIQHGGQQLPMIAEARNKGYLT